MEIESVPALIAALESGAGLSHLRLQGLDLRGQESLFDGRTDVEGLVVLGGHLDPGFARWLTRAGAVIFPSAPHVPVDPYRAQLYQAAELYAGLSTDGYAATPDACAYAWSHDPAVSHDAYVAVLRAIHDTAMGDALDEIIDDRDVVGIMGGHEWLRDDPRYPLAAHWGFDLAQAGILVVTGGGPGAMEAANLGAYATDRDALARALAALARAPGYEGDIGTWARTAFVARGLARGHPWQGPPRSVGIPTWFYGHEPPNVFCDGIAKFFSNALREDGLITRCRGGVVVLPGAAGTVQEIFQAVTPLFYVADDEPLPPLVLVGREHWTQRIPVWPAVQALADGRRMEDAIHLVDDLRDLHDLDVLTQLLVTRPAASQGWASS